MDAERAREFLLRLPHVAETMQWGDNLVFWAGDKLLGGKMFTLINLDVGDGPVISFAAGPEHAAELCEVEGLRPAPYFARLHWVAADRWDALTQREWERELLAAHGIVYGKLPAKVQQLLVLPEKERARLAAERKAALAKSAAKKSPRRRAG